MLVGKWMLWAMVLRAPEGEGAGGGTETPAAPAATDTGTPAAPAAPAETLIGGEDGKPEAEKKPAGPGDTLIGGEDGEDEKPDGEKKDDAEAEKKEGEDGDDAPEIDAAALKLPDDQPMDQAALDAFLPVAKELKLTTEQAQKLVTLEAKLRADQFSAYYAQVGAWADETRADPEIGGANLKESQRVANASLREFGTDGLRKLFRDLGIGNHPEVVRYAARVGKAMGAGRTIPAGGAPASQQSLAERIYGGN